MIGAELANLPWATVLFLAAGYAGYFVANTGAREHHKATDTAFSSAVFGFFALFAYQILTRHGIGILWGSMASFAVACIVGGVWRKWGRLALWRAMRMLHVTFTDDVQSAWTAIGSATNVSATQLAVHLKNGTILQNCNLSLYHHLPNGPCVLGGNGDVLMYVTDVKEAGSETKTNDALSYQGWGNEITYIPASEIARIELRRIVTS